jgi:hypothetical protein
LSFQLRNSIMRLLILFIVLSLGYVTVRAAEDDWFEGSSEADDGATRDFYNRDAQLPWDNYLGDWTDADDTPQGNNAYATAALVDDDAAKWVEWDVTQLVKEWISGTYPNKGMFLHAVSGSSTHVFRSREYSDQNQIPQLVITTTGGAVTLAPAADTYLEPSTYQCMGTSEDLRISGNNNILLRFGLGDYTDPDAVVSAVLRLYSYQQYGNMDAAGIFRCNQGHVLPLTPPETGLASQYNLDQGIENDPYVVFFTGFESDNWQDGWTSIGNPDNGAQITTDDAGLFEPLLGKAVRSRIPEGTNGGMSLLYDFADETGAEPEEIYFRYYLRMADNWQATVDGGKLPGISGTYGIAGWGGRRSDGTDGWSARGTFHQRMSDDNPLSPRLNPIGWYCYHADMPGTYGDIWLWTQGGRGYLANNRWYCIEEYARMNTITNGVGNNNGILRAWVDGRLAFEKTDIRFRHVDNLKIERIWMNVYHGGTAVTAQDMDLYFDNIVIARSYIGPTAGLTKFNKPDPEESINAEDIYIMHAPFTGFIRIMYTIPEENRVRIDIHNSAGRLIRTLIDEKKAPGSHVCNWDGYDDHGIQAANGVFIIRLMQNDAVIKARILLMR